MARILLVEDDDFTATLLGMHLKEAGHEIFTAEDGLVAPPRALQHKVDAVVLDYMLPAANGLLVLKRLREHPQTASLPVVMISGYPREEAMRGAESDPLVRFLAKPVDFKDLTVLLAELLNSRPKP